MSEFNQRLLICGVILAYVVYAMAGCSKHKAEVNAKKDNKITFDFNKKE